MLYIAIFFLVLSFGVKLVALKQLANKQLDEVTRLRAYAKWSLPSYILLIPAVICIGYMLL